MQELVEKQYIATKSVNTGVQRMYRLYSRADIEKFRSTYVSSRELGVTKGPGYAALAREIEQRVPVAIQSETAKFVRLIAAPISDSSGQIDLKNPAPRGVFLCLLSGRTRSRSDNFGY